MERSSATSFIVHLLAVLVIGLLGSKLATRDPTPPEVDVIQIADSPTAAEGQGDGLPPPMALESTKPEMQQPQLPASPTTKVDEVNTVIEEKSPNAVEKDRENITKQIQGAQQTLSDINNAIQKIKDNIGRGEGKGDKPGSGRGTDPTSRGARQARWVIHFQNRSGRDYLVQWNGLGAEIAIPADGGKLKIFSDIASQPPKSSLRDLGSENRMTWILDNRALASEVLQLLGATGDSFITLLPLALEAKMTKMEQARAAENGRTEADIATTEFAIITGGPTGYDLELIEQRYHQ